MTVYSISSFIGSYDRIQKSLKSITGKSRTGRDSRTQMSGILTVILLAGALMMTAGSALGSGMAVTEIRAQVMPTIVVDVPDDLESLDLSAMEPGESYVKTGTANIKANVPWQLIVEDKDSSTSGHMREWAEDSYGENVLKNPLRVLCDDEVSLPNEKGIPVKVGGRTGGAGEDVRITFVQDVDEEEDALMAGSSYRIIVTYIGSPVV